MCIGNAGPEQICLLISLDRLFGNNVFVGIAADLDFMTTTDRDYHKQ